MSQPTNGSPLSPCQGCNKPHKEVRCMVAFPGNVNLCNECVDLAAEIVHGEEHLGGVVRVEVKEIEELRQQAREARYARKWLDDVRGAVERADAALRDTPIPHLEGGE